MVHLHTCTASTLLHHNNILSLRDWKVIDISYYHDVKVSNIKAVTKYSDCIILLNHADMLRCKEHAKLLRSADTISKWLQQQNRQGYFLFTIKEFGIKAVKAHIVAVKSFSNRMSVHNNSRETDWVTGWVMRYATGVKTYVFQSEKTNIISKISATPEHKFYIVSKRAFLPVSKVTPEDTLVNSQGEKVRPLCPEKCGAEYNHEQLTPVYNLEINHSHHYFAGGNNILVHNGCFDDHLRSHLKNRSPEYAAEFIVFHVNKYVPYSSTRLMAKDSVGSSMWGNVIHGIINNYRGTFNTPGSPHYGNLEYLISLVLESRCGDGAEMCHVGCKALLFYSFEHPIRMLKLGGNLFLELGEAGHGSWIADPWGEAFYPASELTEKIQLYHVENEKVSILSYEEYWQHCKEKEKGVFDVIEINRRDYNLS